MKESKNAFDIEHPLHTFSVGIAGSPDLVAARKVADFLGTQHHEFTFTVEEGIDALYDIIWHIESYEQVCIVLKYMDCCQACTVLPFAPPLIFPFAFSFLQCTSIPVHTVCHSPLPEWIQNGRNIEC